MFLSSYGTNCSRAVQVKWYWTLSVGKTSQIVTICMGHLIPKLSMITLSVLFEPSKANQPRKSQRIVEFLLFWKCVCIVHFEISMWFSLVSVFRFSLYFKNHNWKITYKSEAFCPTVRLTPIKWINNQTVWCFLDLLESWCACSPWLEWQLRSEDWGMRTTCSTTVRVASWCQQCLASGCYPTKGWIYCVSVAAIYQ